MSSHLVRRVNALEASQSPPGKIVAFWAMTAEGEPMTDREIENKISALQLDGAPASARFVPVQWQTA